ncbi:MAG: hypothetical protein WBS20_06475 [Lysobacterales bacterium]
MLAGFLLSCNDKAQDTGGQRTEQLAPPVGVSCDRKQLTSWSGEVTGYHRDEQTIWIEISTDEQTVKDVTIKHQGFADASAHYLLWGEPFRHSNWTALEATPGKLIEGMHATVWICSDGRTPAVIDWRPDRN